MAKKQDSFFRSMLKEIRRRMSPKTRAKTDLKKIRRMVWLYPSHFERRYAKVISQMLKKLTSYATEELKTRIMEKIDRENVLKNKIDSIRQDDFAHDFKEFMERLRAEQLQLFGNYQKNNFLAALIDLGHDTSDFNQSQWQKYMKESLGNPFYIDEPWLTPTIDNWANENFDLIKSLSDDYIKRVNTIVSNGVQGGTLTKDIMKSIYALNDTITRSKATLIARDQVGKLNGLFTKSRQADAGIEMYIWETVGDNRVRGYAGGKYPYAVPSHSAINGKLCRWDDNGVYSPDEGITWKKRPANWPQTIPGMEIQCRCWASPFLSKEVREIDQELTTEAKNLPKETPIIETPKPNTTTIKPPQPSSQKKTTKTTKSTLQELIVKKTVLTKAFNKIGFLKMKEKDFEQIKSINSALKKAKLIENNIKLNTIGINKEFPTGKVPRAAMASYSPYYKGIDIKQSYFKNSVKTTMTHRKDYILEQDNIQKWNKTIIKDLKIKLQNKNLDEDQIFLLNTQLKNAEQRLNLSLISKRWSISTASENPLEVTLIHEMGHALYYETKGFKELWSRNLFKYGASIEEKLKVSKYANTASTELFAETFAAWKSGFKDDITGGLLKAFEETIKETGVIL